MGSGNSVRDKKRVALLFVTCYNTNINNSLQLMTKAIMKKDNALISFDEPTVELIKNTIAVGATNQELNLFLYQAKRTGLDPLARQLYFIKRKVKDSNGNWIDKATIQTSIDGFRVIAERSKDYAGQDEPKFEQAPNSPFPTKCTVTVYRFRGQTRYPAGVGVAYWNEYAPAAGQDFMWNKMPHTMLSKVAEALALRKAFPQDLSGLYTTDEMDQANIKEIKSEEPKPISAQAPLIDRLRAFAIKLQQSGKIDPSVPIEEMDEKQLTDIRDTYLTKLNK